MTTAFIIINRSFEPEASCGFSLNFRNRSFASKVLDAICSWNELAIEDSWHVMSYEHNGNENLEFVDDSISEDKIQETFIITDKEWNDEQA